MNIAVLASGNGSNLQAIIRALQAKKIRGTLRVVFSDKKDAFALERARKAKVPVVESMSPKDFPTREAFDLAVADLLLREEVKLVVLAGYMRILSPVFIRAFPNRIMNVHPALLPAFKGARALEDALKYGARVTGVTVHFVDEEVDHGPVILQAAVEIKSTDTVETLAARVHKVEHQLYPRAIDLFVRGRLTIRERSVRIS